jgi:hypothetical protein
MTKSQADLICELRAGARELTDQHALNLAAGVLHDLAERRRTRSTGALDPAHDPLHARIAAALGAARVAAYGTADADPDESEPAPE